MSELDVIQKTKVPVTLSLLDRDFKKLGIDKGDIILVHSSLSAIGWVCGEERTVIEALLAAVGDEGTVCMPAHSSGNSDPAGWANPPVPGEWNQVIYDSMPAYDPQITPTRGIGRIAEQFRSYPGTLRSNHPHTSFTANGKYAQEITEGHILTPQFGMGSPLGMLYQLDAKVLLLGAAYASCTCFHMGEVLCGKIPKVRQGAAMEVNGSREWVWFDDYEYDNDDFILLGNDFENEFEVIKEKAGNADCKLFGIRAAVDYAAKWLVKHR